MTVIQAVLIALYYVIAESPWPFGSMGTWATIDRPLVSGLFVGIIMGDPVQGCIIGATINIMYLGVISAGGTLPEDSSMAGIMGTAFALAGGLDTNAALALAVPLGVIGSVVWILTMTAQCFVVQLAQKWINEGKSKRMMFANVWLPQGVKAIIRFILAYVIVYFGSMGVVAAADAMNGSPVLQALSVMGGVLPAVGIGVMLTTIFKEKARIFLFLGFFAASFLGLNTIAIALIFGCIAILVVGFNKEDFAAFSETKDAQETSYKLIDKKLLRKMWLRWEMYCESCYNYEIMQGLGFCNAMVPVLEKLYSNDNEELTKAMQRQSVFFNTDHNFGGMIMGVCASMEEQRKLGKEIDDDAFTSLKSGLMGPCAGIGDTLSQVVLIPVLAVIFINLAQQGQTWAPIAYTALFMLIWWGAGWWMCKTGYEQGGEAVLRLMESGLFKKAIDVANILGCAVSGALIVNYVTLNWTVSVVQEGVTIFDLQTGVFDAICPNIMPLVATMLIYKAIKDGKKMGWVMLVTMGVSFLLALLGLIG